MKAFQAGFTFVELLVVSAIMAILATTIYVNIGNHREQARDIERQADLRAIESALELYRLEYGRYPAQCAAAGGGGWSGQIGTDFECDDGTNNFIVSHLGSPGLEDLFIPNFLPVMPTDPRPLDNNSGYVYRVDAAGEVYKLIAYRSVETDEMSTVKKGNNSTTNVLKPGRQSELRLCPLTLDTGGFAEPTLCFNTDYPGWPPNHCDIRDAADEVFITSYAVYNGFSTQSSNEIINERNTEAIICDTPDG